MFLVLVFGVVAVSPALGQMTYGTNYSDTWLVGVNQPTSDQDGNWYMTESRNPEVYVWGYGAVDGNTASYSHYYSPMTTTMYGPDGRSSSTTTSGSGYVRADISMLLSGPGNYSTTHHEYAYCPGCSCYHVVGGASSGKSVGISYATYEKVQQHSPEHATYKVISPCNVTCVGGSGTFVFLAPPLPPYFVIGEPWVVIAGFRVCESFFQSYRESVIRQECRDVTLL